jgi:anti-sigma B factor antagonist
MEITTKTFDEATIIEICGELDGKTASSVQKQLGQVGTAGSKILLDMSGVSYLSSAGLRVLLMLYRQVAGASGRMVLVGLSPEIRDTLSETGFLAYFATSETCEAGLAAL